MASLVRSSDKHGSREIAYYDHLNPDFPFYIGKVVYRRNSVALIPEIFPDAFEITYQTKGMQIYEVQSQRYEVNTGDAFITLPNELRSTGGVPFDKSSFYYMIAHFDLFGSGCIGVSDAETRRMLDRLRSLFAVRKTVAPGPQAKKYFECLMNLYEQETPYKYTILRNTLSDLLLCLIHSAEKESHQEPQRFDGVIQYIREHIYEYISLDELAAVAEMSKPRFQVKFKEDLYFPPREFIVREKIREAQRLLRDTEATVTDIAMKLGFSSVQYFSAAFKQYTTFTPRDYKTNYKSS